MSDPLADLGGIKDDTCCEALMPRAVFGTADPFFEGEEVEAVVVVGMNNDVVVAGLFFDSISEDCVNQECMPISFES